MARRGKEVVERQVVVEEDDPIKELRQPYDWNRSLSPLSKKRYFFDIKYAEALVEHMALGGSYVAFAGRLRIPAAVLDKWMNEEPAFMEAVAIGEAAYLAYWEEINRGASAGEIKSNAAAMIFRLKNSFPELYKDRQENEDTNKPTTIIIQTGIDRNNLVGQQQKPIMVEYTTQQTPSSSEDVEDIL